MQLTAQEIAAIYQAEQATQPKARTLDDVPGTYEVITAEWLTAVLCRSSPGAQVTEFRLADRNDGSSNRARIYLTYNDAGQRASLPPTILCKGAMTVKSRILLTISKGAFSETMFFLKVRDHLGIETPQHIHAAFNPKTHAYIIVMEDIGATTHFCNEKTVITRAHAEGAVNTLAKLHAKFYNSPELGTESLPFRNWGTFWDGLNYFEGFPKACDDAFGLAESVIPPRLFKRRADIWPATIASVKRHEVLPRTLTHCDVHLANWYIAGNGEMGLTDWQVANVGHWSRDFIYAMSTMLSIEDRRAWFDDLLRLYLDKMVEYGAPRIAFDEAMLNVRQQLMTTLAFWTNTLVPAPGLPPMQPESISYELIKRITAAMDDMDTLGAFS